MDIGKLLLSHPVTEPENLRIVRLDPQAIEGVADFDDEKRKKVARDFESIFIHQLLNKMKDTIPDSNLLEDSSSEQIKSIYWSYLSEAVADNGGLGLWEQIYQNVLRNDQGAVNQNTLDESV